MTTTQPNASLAPGASLDLGLQLTTKRKSQLRLIGERFLRNKVSVFGLCVLIIIALGVIFAPLLAPGTKTYDPTTTPNLAIRFQGPSLHHLLGADYIGRDEFARLLYGGRVSMEVGFAVAIISVIIGVVVGAVAGYYGGWVDTIMMRITDALLSVPLLLILIVLSKSFGNGKISDVVIIISAFEWLILARIVRGEFLALKEREFLLAARTLGASNLRLMFRHILPNAIGPIVVGGTLAVGDAILIESTLSFFGFGINPPTPSWGNMVNDAQGFLSSDALLAVLPGLAILVTVLCVNLMGDGLRDSLDPYMTQR